VSPNWYFSQIPWGAWIRRRGEGVQYRADGGLLWEWATKPRAKLREPLEPSDFDGLPEDLTGDEPLWRWNKNDFGPLAWNLVPSDQYLHTTPDDENATRAVGLRPSHGCVHLVPSERDDMVSRGYLARDVRVTVRSMEAHLLPARARRAMMAP
jgi:hypothetical protein